MLANKFVLLILFTKKNVRLIKSRMKKKKTFHTTNNVTTCNERCYVSQNREREREREKQKKKRNRKEKKRFAELKSIKKIDRKSDRTRGVDTKLFRCISMAFL